MAMRTYEAILRHHPLQPDRRRWKNMLTVELLAKRLNVTPPSRRQIVSQRFITYLDAGGDAGVTMIRFLQEAL